MDILYYIGLLFKSSIALTLILISFLIIVLVVIPLYDLRFYKKQGLPSYFFPIAGYNKHSATTEKLNGDPLGYYKDLAKADPNATVLASNFFTQVELHLFDPKLIKEFLQNTSLYHKSFLPRLSKILVGDGLFLAEGNLWKKHRKVIASVFHFEYLRTIVPLVVNTTRDFFSKIAKEGPQEIIVTDEIQKITGDVIGITFFGETVSQYVHEGQCMTTFLSSLVLKFADIVKTTPMVPMSLFGIKLERNAKCKAYLDEIKGLRQFCMKVIQDRKASGQKKNDLLGTLIETQNAASPDDRYSDDAIVDEFISFFLGGMDTTGHLVTICLYLIHEHPEVLEQVKKEINEVYNREDIPSYDTLGKMEVMHSVIKEALRMYNPAPNTAFRTAQEDHMLGNIKIKKGTSVKAIFIYNFFNEKYFEEPEKFKPERWYGNKGKELDPYVFVPFSAGARNCVGQHLATIETKVIMAEFIKSFGFKVVPEGYKLVMSFSPLYIPKDKIVMRLERK